MEQKVKCSFDPKTYADQPIGMFHCPECDGMVIAGIDHPDYDDNVLTTVPESKL